MRFQLPDDKKLVHETTIQLRWGDQDLMAHINNANYFRYLEQARIEWLIKIGAPPNPRGTGPVIANAFCNFYRQLEYPGTVLAKHYIANLGSASFDTFITLERTDDLGVIYAEGGATTVWVDFDQRRSVPVPDWVRELF